MPGLSLYQWKMQEIPHEVEFPPPVFPTSVFSSFGDFLCGDLNSRTVLLEVLQGFGKHKSQDVLAVFK